jgi:3-isopropylmalate/(R)-2-methylmalate dehydratase small subunit
MQKVEIIEGTGLPLNRSDVDTDQIIPSDWLKRVERTGFGKGLFSEWRDDREFVLNKPEYAKATILVAGQNFGTGSSREHAVWAIQDYGFKAVISPRFADIFKNNCTKMGLVPVELDSTVVSLMLNEIPKNPELLIVVDVKNLTVSIPELSVEEKFAMDSFVQYRFLNGLDDIGLTLANGQAISDYESNRFKWLPKVTL